MIRIRWWQPSRIALRLLAFNLLVVFVPAVGVLYLDVYEAHLREAQERAMVQQARVLAAAFGDAAAVDGAAIEQTLARLERRNDARFRVYDARGLLLADSVRMGPAAAPEADAYSRSSESRDVRARVLYRIGAWIATVRDRMAAVPSWSPIGRVPGDAPAASAGGSEAAVHAALAGRYGAATRVTSGQRSVTLFVAVPIRHDGAVVGAVLVSQSTLRILRALYDVRLRIFEIVIASLVAAAFLTGLAAMTIVSPLTRLRRRASALAARSGPLPESFPGADRKDELGDLARALEVLTRRANDHVALIQSFAADVSHEFKNPLASIRTAGEMMAVADSKADRDRFLELMTRDVARLERLVSGLREVAVVEGQMGREPTAPVDVADLLREIAGAANATGVRQAPVVLRADGTPVVRGSRERLAQVFENLVANAIGLSPADSAIEIDVAIRGGACSIRVDDRGPGIPETHLQRVFERFFTYRPAGGRGDHVGLGLAIARQIIESYGGTITAANRSGGGASFEVSLPVAR
jgi:two-component system, OmpR family, sensor histidine kinase ChvG